LFASARWTVEVEIVKKRASDARTQLRSRSDTWTGICSQDSSATHLPQRPQWPGIGILLLRLWLPAFDGRDGDLDHGGGSRTVGIERSRGSQTGSIEFSCPQFGSSGSVLAVCLWS
jgi:hypothetical protein